MRKVLMLPQRAFLLGYSCVLKSELPDDEKIEGKGLVF
jgi:hypothetical protein